MRQSSLLRNASEHVEYSPSTKDIFASFVQLTGSRSRCSPPTRDLLELQQPLSFLRQILHLRQNLVLQLRIIADPRIQRAYSSNRRVQMFEQLARDTSRDL